MEMRTDPAGGQSRLRLAMLIAAAAIIGGAQWWLFPRTVDDAFITFRQLLMVGTGHGIAFNPGGPPVEGFSHPLFFLLLLPFALLPMAAVTVPLAAKALGVAATLGTASLMIDAMARLRVGTGVMVAALVAWLLYPGTLIYSSLGLETPLLAWAYAYVLWCEASDRPRWQPAAALGLAAVLRPEAPLAAALWFVWRWWRDGAFPGMRTMVLLGAPFVCWLLFRVAYFGDSLPMPAKAKPPGTFGEGFGQNYLAKGALCWLPLFAFAMPFAKDSRRVGLAAAALTAPGVVLAVYSKGDWMPFGRFLVPALPVVLIATATIRMPRFLMFASLVVMLALSWWDFPKYADRRYLNGLLYGDEQLGAGDWIAARIRPGESLATVRLGGLAYRLPDHVVHDIAGLTDAEVARHLWSNGGSIAWESNPVRRRRPDWIAVVPPAPGMPPHGDDALEAELHASYEFVGTGGDQAFYRRKASIAER